MSEYEESLTAYVAEQRSANKHAWEHLRIMAPEKTLADMHPVEQAIRAEIHDDPDGGYGKAGRAVLAVLDLHKPTPDGDPYEDPGLCSCCFNAIEEQRPYPCPTVKVIADALGVTP